MTTPDKLNTPYDWAAIAMIEAENNPDKLVEARRYLALAREIDQLRRDNEMMYRCLNPPSDVVGSGSVVVVHEDPQVPMS